MTTVPTQPDLADGPAEVVKGRSLWHDAWRRFRRKKMAMISLAVIVVYVIVALLVATGLLAGDWNEEVGPRYQAPSADHWFGTDIFGRSTLRMTLYSAKTSLTVALFASVISICIGVPMGAMAGYFGGKVDEFIVWLYSVLASIPGLLLILAFAFVLRDVTVFGYSLQGMPAIYLALGLTGWVYLCRLIRGEVMKHRSRDYVTAARSYGCSQKRIILKHIVPNVTHLILIDFSLRFVGYIHAEVILSYLGLGPVKDPSWGKMIDAAKLELQRGHWWELTAATLAIFFISVALNIASDALRDALDPKLKT